MNEPAHSPLGPSASDRWIACPGSVLATRDLPEVDTQWALQGTAAHAAAEQCRALDIRAEDLPTQFMQVRKADGSGYAMIPYDQQMKDGVQAFIDYVNDLPGDDYNEERVYYTEYVKDGFGTMDAAKATWKHVDIIDLKFGEGLKIFAKYMDELGIVSGNTQLMLYALGFWIKYGWLYAIESFTLHVFQPRLDHIDTFDISLADLLKWADEVARPAALLAADEWNAPFAAGEHCTFCKIRRQCEVRAKHLTGSWAKEMDDLNETIDKPPPKLAVLSNEQIAKILALKSQITKWLTEISDYAMQELQHGREVGGWKLVEGRSNRTWNVATRVLEAAVIEEGLDHRLMWEEPTLKSPAQLEEVYGRGLFAEATKKKAAGRFNSLITKPRGSPTLAPPGDKRESILANPDNEMEEV